MEKGIPKALEFSYGKKYAVLKPDSVKTALIILGSPRKEGVSKTRIFADAFAAGLSEAGAGVEFLELRDKKINHCVGCFTCWTKTPGKCIHKDDVAGIMERAEKADLVVYASPLYHFGIISLLKKYIERTLPSLLPYMIKRDDGETTHPHRPGFKDTTNVAILGVCGFPEVSHFGAMSANFHYMANAGGDHGMNIVAELYRPYAETLNNPFFTDEAARVLAETKKAGFELVKKGFVAPETVDAIAEVRHNMDEVRSGANLAWDACIKDGITMPELQEMLLGRK